MEENSNRDILNNADTIESGQFFVASWNWYSIIYLKPFAEQAIMAIMAIIMLSIIGIMLWGIKLSMPIKKQFIYIKYIAHESIDDIVMRLKDIDTDRYTPPQWSVAQYLVDTYVFLRESYVKNNSFLTYQNSFVSRNSSYKVFTAFQQENTEQNTDIKKIAKVRSMKFNNNNPFGDTVDVTYDVQIINEDGTTNNKTKHARLTFSLSQIKLQQNVEKNKMTFLVTKFEAN